MGICRLCLKMKPLMDSHMLSKAAYKRVRGEGRNPHPYFASEDMAIQTSHQITDYLLCADCEKRFSEEGENPFFQYCLQPDGRFRLLEELRSNGPVLETADHDIYQMPESVEGIVHNLAYFGTSIFWRSAVHDWKVREEPVVKVQLGKAHLEQFRSFLLGGYCYPPDASLVIEISDESNRLANMFNTPASKRTDTNYIHWFDMCGVHFNLFVGSRMPKELRTLSVYGGQRVLAVAKRKEAFMARMYRKHLSVYTGTKPSTKTHP